MDTIDKQNSKGGNQLPHIGNLVAEIMKQKKMTVAEVARKLGVTSSSVANYLRNDSLQIRILWQLAVVLEYNFLADVMDFLPEKVLNSTESSFQKSITAQASEILDLKKEIEIYKGILEGKG